MHILLVTSYFEPDSGAAAVRLSRLARLLQRRGNQVTVLTTLPYYPKGVVHEDYRGAWEVEERHDGVRIIHTWLWTTPSPKISRRLLSQLSFTVAAALRGLSLPRPDVILIESQPVFTSLAGVFLSRVMGVPYVLNVSDFWPEYLLAVGVLKSTSPLYRVFYALVNYTFRHASQMVTLYPALTENVGQRSGHPDKATTIYNAVDLERFRPGLDTTAFKAQHGLGDKKIISFIGTFAIQYDFDTMLDVAAHFNQREDVQFVFIGTGGQRDKVSDRLAQPELSHARWIGWMDYADMPLAWNASYIAFWAINAHDLYRSTIQAKTYEAMACGVPMAIAVEGITTDILQRSQSGLTVPFQDTAGLIDSITRLLDDEALYRHLSLSARDYAEQHFDPHMVTERYEAVLAQALRG